MREEKVHEEIAGVFGNRLRVRVCGICVQDNEILLVNTRDATRPGDFWSPPGGGMHFGEPAHEALRREFREETGLEIAVGEFMFVHEFIGLPLHAIELFFRVEVVGGQLAKGRDPELRRQVIAEVSFYPFHEIRKYEPAALHNLFRHCSNVAELLALRGYYQNPADR